MGVYVFRLLILHYRVVLWVLRNRKSGVNLNHEIIQSEDGNGNAYLWKVGVTVPTIQEVIPDKIGNVSIIKNFGYCSRETSRPWMLLYVGEIYVQFGHERGNLE